MQKPNVIFIITDQQRYDTIRALGYDYMETPHMDKLVREGISFENCFITAASCAPARASLFTGYYPHTTGIFKNADSWKRSWVEDLSNAGYRCVNVGKMHSYPYHTPLGFHERYVVENKDRYLEERYFFDEWDKALKARGLIKQQRELYRKRSDYKQALGAFDWELPEDMHPDAFVGDTATWWIHSYPKTEPLFLQIGFPGPHPPYDPTKRFSEPYLKKDLPLMEVTQEELDGLPQPLKNLRTHNNQVDHDSVILDLEPTFEQRKRQRAYYLANVSMIDEKIGQILQALEENGYLENGIVVFTSDHGDCLTDHGHSQKWTMYDLVTRVPLIVWAPKFFEGGRMIDGLCQHMDIGPAILEMAGLSVSKTLEAESILPVLEKKEWTPRKYVYAEQIKDGILTDAEFMTMVRNQDWKMVHFLGMPCGQLFNLKEDPQEVHNLWDCQKSQDVKRKLLDQLLEWRIQSQVITKDWSSEWR